MAQSITLLGATYNDVPAVDLPKTGGGTARFWDATDGNNLEYGDSFTLRTMPYVGAGQADYMIL